MLINLIAMMVWFSFWNCARGRKLFGLTTSTETGRIVSMTMMAFGNVMLHPLTPDNILIFAASFAMLMLWCSPGWDAYWSVTIGQSTPPVAAFAPVDYIMGLPPFKWLKGRWWGLAAMTLRMQLILPYFVLNMCLLDHFDRLLYLGSALALALPYFIFGCILPVRYVIPAAEIGVGLLIGGLSFLMFVN